MHALIEVDFKCKNTFAKDGHGLFELTGLPADVVATTVTSLAIAADGLCIGNDVSSKLPHCIRKTIKFNCQIIHSNDKNRENIKNIKSNYHRKLLH